MQYEITKMRAKTVKGVGLQTDNSPENCAVFGKVWSEFMPIVGKISGRTNENCIGLYTDYTAKNFSFWSEPKSKIRRRRKVLRYGKSRAAPMQSITLRRWTRYPRFGRKFGRET